ncbi:type II secretion system protein [Pararhodospirillum oryzae]|uniref:Prepilin-type N-terminal cleavage/methylation domain-containing protein n=1 Tax=Pararhodospirillum oryzae TaxID=478448 RepID=A0A512HAF1_9PROT|nr:hypothetical protein [Pararhodospirillum oryzae]GEO82426.1 hypothetical protein ROR02_25570 [Pararhodospirillum oryzae]
MEARHAVARAGFALVEMALVVALVGGAAWGLLAVLGPVRQRDKEAGTQVRIVQVANALAAAARLHGALPCPEGQGDGVRESGPCRGTEGAVPWLALGLAPEAAQDAWNRPLAYRVSPQATAAGALSCTGTLPEATIAVVGSDLETPQAALFAVASSGAGNRLVGAGGVSRLSAAPLAANPTGVVAFDGRVLAWSPERVRLAMGCTPGPPQSLDVPLDVPVTASGLMAQTPLVWTPRGGGGRVLDSGSTRLVLASGAVLEAQGGTLAVASDDSGLGVWSGLAAQTGRGMGTETAADLATDADGHQRTLSIEWARAVTQVHVVLVGLVREKRAPFAWRQARGEGDARCLEAPAADRSCPVDWIEGVRLQAWSGDDQIGETVLQACPDGDANAKSVFEPLGFGGVSFTRVRLIAEPVRDASGAALGGESSVVRLAGLTASREAEAPAALDLALGCGERP